MTAPERPDMVDFLRMHTEEMDRLIAEGRARQKSLDRQLVFGVVMFVVTLAILWWPR